MGEIPRYRMISSLGHQDNVNGNWVRYEDHFAFAEAKEQAVSDALMGDYLEGYLAALDDVLNEIVEQHPESLNAVRFMVRHMIDDVSSE
jgi:hypothetical protein